MRTHKSIPLRTKEPRASRKWWTIDGNAVRRVTGYSCAPNNPESWWCPEVGYTLQESHHLFESEAQAIDECVIEIKESIDDLFKSLDKLSKRRQNL